MTKQAETVTIPTEEYEALKTNITQLQQQVDYLLEQVRLAKHRQFGSSSEKSEYDGQLNWFNEAEVTADVQVAEPELCEVEKHFRKKARERKDRLPADLPVEVVEHTLPPEEQECPACGSPLHVMGKEIRRELKLIPATAVIVEHVKYVYSCRECEKNSCGVPVVKAPMDEPVIKGSFASPEAVAHLMTQKFVMGTPLYRQEQEWKRQGIKLSRQTMSNWMLKCTEDWLEPIYAALRENMLKNFTTLHADETTLQVLREPGKTAQSKSYMWLYRTSGYNRDGVTAPMPIVLYEYQPDRKAQRPKDFLNGYKGYLHTDGYAGYHNLPEGIVVVGCWAHARRKFEEALKGMLKKDQKGSGALLGKQYCDRLFAIEKRLTDLSPEQRFQKRQEQARPVLDAFLSWLDSQHPIKNGFGKAVHYTIEQWKYLERYLLDGGLEISNNRAERSIKPFVIDRKNFLFANTPRGAKASAVMFSIIETAKENGLNPFEYLTYIFRTAPNLELKKHPEQVAGLLPDAVPEAVRAHNWRSSDEKTNQY